MAWRGALAAASRGSIGRHRGGVLIMAAASRASFSACFSALARLARCARRLRQHLGNFWRIALHGGVK